MQKSERKRKKRGHMKVPKKKIWTHASPKHLIEKKDEHMKAHVLEKRDSHVLKIKVRERSLMLRSIEKQTYHLFPHTCTSWSKSMTFLSLDPRFDFIIYAIQVCLYIFPYLSTHKLLAVGRKRHCYDVPWWESIHHWVILEYHLRSTCELCFISKKTFQKLQVSEIQKLEEMTLFQSRSTTQLLKEIC